MTLDFINKYPVIKNWLMRKLGYYSKGFYQFKNGKLVSKLGTGSKIIILAKCHYSETWQSFSSIHQKELVKLLALKQGNSPSLFFNSQVYKNDNIDGFDVKTIKIEQSVINTLGQDKIYIPETELFKPSKSTQLFEIETLIGKVFCADVGNKVKASYAKGIVKNVETYKLSVGLSDDIQLLSIDSHEFSNFLLSQLFGLKLTSLFKVISFDIKSWFETTQLHLLYWAPLLTAFCFHILFNSYLYLKINSVEKSLSDGGEQVSEIFFQKKHLDDNLDIISRLSEEFIQQEFVHNHWLIVDHLLTTEMKIIRITFKEKKLIIRGMADKASDVLTTISSNKFVTSAAFDGPVRKSNGKDLFILTLQVKGF